MCLGKSKFGCVLAVAILSIGVISMCAQPEQDMERFVVGQRLGDCLVKGCTVFLGTIQALGPPEKAPGEADERRAVMTRNVDMKVDQWLYAPEGATTVQLSHATRPEVGKTSLGPWVAWEGVRLDVGGQLLVARWAKEAPRPTWMGKPDDVAFVASDQSLFVPAREVIGRHQHFRVDPNELDKIPQLLRDKRDDLFAGYFLTYLMNSEGVRNVDKAAALLSGLLGQESVPAPARADIADWLASNFYRLAEATRKAVTETLVLLASGDDAGSSDPALACLEQLGELKMLDLKPFLTPGRRRKLVEKYRVYQAQSKAREEHSELEVQLGLR